MTAVASDRITPVWFDEDNQVLTQHKEGLRRVY